MAFEHPWVLWALTLTAIPVIIHLFNFRRHKTVYFTNVRFLKEVTEETAVRSKLKHLLVLLARLLTIIFIVLAFARPVIPGKDSSSAAAETKSVSVYIDNSFSMSAEYEGERLLDRAIRKCREIVDAYEASTRFQLVTNELTSRQRHYVSKEEFLSLLDEVQPSSFVRKHSAIYSWQMRTAADAGALHVSAFWISDFQKNQSDFKGDTSLALYLFPLNADRQDNVYIDTAWLNQPAVYPNRTVTVFVRIVNTAKRPVENSRMTLSVDNQVKAIADYSVPAASYTVDTLNFMVRDTGWKRTEISITDYPVTFDDKFFLVLRVTGVVPVLAVYEAIPSRYLDALFQNTESFSFENRQVNQLDYSRLDRHNLIILSNLTAIPSGMASILEQYVKNGGSLLIFPAKTISVGSYNSFLSMLGAGTLGELQTSEQPVTELNREHEIFYDVFEEIPKNISLPIVKAYYPVQKKTRSSQQVLLGLRNRSPFLSQFEYGQGKIYLCAAPLDEKLTDFPLHALFVPLLYNMALTGKTFSKAAYVIGKDEVIEIDNRLRGNDLIFKIRGGNSEFIPRQKAAGPKMLIFPGEEITQAGFYTIYTEDDKEGDVIAMNYNREESLPEFYSAPELKDLYPQRNIQVIQAVNANASAVVKELQEGVALWKLCIILALVFMGAEAVLLRFLR
ncbi:MAG: hypothetical protein KatS3mg031_1900 [Chitinophagales bacterium]|nr:MAG: hypothetical protein KatS3mg031_1900 [Chitinophagales bacterium]